MSIEDPEYVSHVQQLLHDVGLAVMTGPVDGQYGDMTHIAVGIFQTAWTFTNLIEDGLCGPLTLLALEDSAANGGRISPNFSIFEFRDRDSLEVWFVRPLVANLELLRAIDGVPLPIVSGYRSAAHNAAVGGATLSMHLHGAAADTPGYYSFEDVSSLRIFSGIGVERETGQVLHVDVREEFYDQSGWQGDGATKEAPAVWYY